MITDGDVMTAGSGPGRIAPSRRAALRAIACLLLIPPGTAARGTPSNLVPLNAPQPMAQLHGTAAGELLAVSTAGILWQYSSDRWIQRAAQLDPGAPIASGHGRVAGRSARGALWVLEGDRLSVSPGPTLAVHGGLLILPFGIIVVAQGSDRHASVVRLEPGPGNQWTETARAIDPVLPDARPLQTDLDRPGRTDDGHIVVPAGPDATWRRCASTCGCASDTSTTRHRTVQPNAVNFDVRPVLCQLAGVDVTQIHGIGPYLALRLIGECGTDLSRWRTARRFTSWLTLSPGCRISGGKVMSAHTRKTTNRVAAHLRLAAVTVGRTNTALGAFYRRLAARIGKAKAVTATARALAFPLSGSTATPTIRRVIIKNFPFSAVYRPEADGVNGGAWRAVKRSPVSNARRAQKPASP